MNRRTFLYFTALTLATPIVAEAQANRLRSIGYLSNSFGQSALDTVFLDGLRDLGYIEGHNITIEKRFSAGRSERFAEFAADLLRLKVDVIAAWGPPAVTAARRATSTTPIVGISMGDPVALGWAASLSRPGGNVTGSANLQKDLSGKRVELMKEALPALSRLALLVNPTSSYTSDYTEAYTEATNIVARRLGVRLDVLNVSQPHELHTAFAEAGQRGVGTVIVLPDPLFWAHRGEVVTLAAKNRLPAMYWSRDYVDAGGLMSYAASLAEMGRRAASFIDRILKGAKPSDLPIEQPTQFELILNLKTAKTLGLKIPASLLARADHVIE